MKKDFAFERLLIFVVVLGVMVLCAFIFPHNDYEKKYEELYDQYLELESKLEKTESDYEKRLDSIYSDMSDTFDPVYTLFDYFVYQEVSFDKASQAFDELHSILLKYH